MRQHGYFREPVENQVEAVLEPALQAGFGDARADACDHHIVAVLPSLNHFRDHLGRVLQIRVHAHNGIPAHVIQPGAERDVLAEVARQIDDLDAGIQVTLGAKAVQRVVEATVIDADDLVAAAEAAQNLA
jgi:hypothetical protein